MTADDYERETEAMLKFLRDWDYMQNCQRDMFLPQFMPPFRMTDDTQGSGTAIPGPSFSEGK